MLEPSSFPDPCHHHFHDHLVSCELHSLLHDQVLTMSRLLSLQRHFQSMFMAWPIQSPCRLISSIHVTSLHFMSVHIISYHIISYHILSYHIGIGTSAAGERASRNPRNFRRRVVDFRAISPSTARALAWNPPPVCLREGRASSLNLILWYLKALGMLILTPPAHGLKNAKTNYDDHCTVVVAIVFAFFKKPSRPS